MRQFILVIAALVCQAVVHADPTKEAEETTKRFAEAMAHFDVPKMVEELHPDVQSFTRQMALHIAETPSSEEDLQGFLKALGVKSVDELRQLDARTVTIRFYESAFSRVTSQFKETSLQSKITVVGSINEGDLVDVLYRTQVNFKELPDNITVPTVVTLKASDGKLKVISTTQFETMKAKLQAIVKSR